MSTSFNSNRPGSEQEEGMLESTMVSELTSIASNDGIELTDEELDSVAGGSSEWSNSEAPNTDAQDRL